MVGALAFLCQALAWSVMMPAQAMAASNSTVGDVITICSVDGIKTIKVGPDGQALPDEDGTAAASGHCPLCPLLAGAGLPPVPPLALPTEQVAAHDARALPGDAIAAGWFLSSLQARAPPSVG